ncbi:hypothetical protein Back11_15090 [Paenibacillus baekrokdamisoli]|uniref:Uncharacterized protein n=1 Tax=Paenibacillus baekrokdamisoli TaxID=1712516 RepID=A0A3G9JA58_9BACL|nr:Ig-like domain-containing protein [Paenibacillus baekrokdamisoli]MBB3072774.1 alpha-tubulin suppressor-like RCC1 family protein [Paenibacillus baekrokdamisoli]BBH20164.1 hypothetical protein Back11_15090 [Paenibacillus baekrokdamisoli]
MKPQKFALILICIFVCMLTISELPVKAAQDASRSTLPRIIQVSAGKGHALAVGTDGTLWAWGDNSAGQLGDGTFISRSAPVQVGGGTEWASVAAGDHLSVAIRKDGSLWMWGTNQAQTRSGLDQAITNQKIPLRYGMATDWVKASAGEGGAAVLRKNGTIKVFGLNVMPGEVDDSVDLNNDKDWSDVSMGSHCLMALKKNGSLWVKGGCIPNGRTVELSRVGNDHDWDRIAASYYSVVRKKDGSVWTLRGDFDTGKLRLEQVTEVTNAVSISGDFVSVIVSTDGSVWKWDTGYDRYEKIQGDAEMIDADDSYGFGVALSRDGVPWTWGNNEWGQRGSGENDTWYEPQAVEARYRYNVRSDFFAYTLQDDGSIWINDLRNAQEKRFGTDTDWASIVAGRNAMYALKKDGSLWSYQESDASISGSAALLLKPFMAGTAWQSVQVSSLGYAVGLQRNGSLWAWGSDAWGLILKGYETAQSPPLQLSKDHDWQSFSVNLDHILAVKKDGTLWGRGDNRRGQLGLPSARKQTDTFTRIDKSSSWVQVQTGEATSIGIQKDGTLWQWGEGFGGKYKTGSMSLLTPDKDWTKAWASSNRFFAQKKDGSLWAWGDNNFGQLGISSAESRSVPTQVIDKGPWVDLYPESYYTIGIKQDGTVWTWGNSSTIMNHGVNVQEMQLAPIQTEVHYRVPEPSWTVSFLPFSVKDTSASVQTQANMHVTVMKGYEYITNGMSDASGLFRFNLPKIRDGVYSAQVMDANERLVAQTYYYVGDTTPPKYPRVIVPKAGSRAVTGSVEPRCTVKIMRSTGVYQGQADAKGNFIVKVPPLIAGEELSIWAIDAVGNRSGLYSFKVAKVSDDKNLVRFQPA